MNAAIQVTFTAHLRAEQSYPHATVMGHVDLIDGEIHVDSHAQERLDHDDERIVNAARKDIIAAASEVVPDRRVWISG